MGEKRENTRLHLETLAYTGKLKRRKISIGRKKGEHSLTRGTKKKEDFYWAKKGRTLAYTWKLGEGRFLLGEKRENTRLHGETTEKEDFYWAKKGDET